MSVIQGGDPTREPSFTLRNRMGRALWAIVYLLLFRPSPRPLHAWRSFLLRLFGARLGPNVHVYPSVRIWAPWNLEAGGHVGIGDGAIIYNMGPVRIGHHSVVSQRAHLCGGSHDVDSDNFQLLTGSIEIGSYVWVCAEAFVGMNVRIAEGAVVGARAVVTRNLADAWTVYAGNPARAIRLRRRSSGNS
jgi:putative colanic acid biosynthesis acetyltransferase WcaF